MRYFSILIALALPATAQLFVPGEQRFAFMPSPSLVTRYVFYTGTNSGSYQRRIVFTNLTWVTATNELTIGLAKTNLVGGVTNFVTATAMDLNGVESEPCPEINFVPPRPPGTIRLSTTVMRSDNPLGPWTVVTNLQTIELAADANQGFYRSRMDVK